MSNLEIVVPIAAQLKLSPLQFLSLNTFSLARLVERQLWRISAFPVLPVIATKPLSLAASDPTTEQTVPFFHPHHQVWEEHFMWSEDGIELVGLTPIGRATIAVLKMNRPQLIRVRWMWVKVGEHPPKFE